jgi:hypothetical protein
MELKYLFQIYIEELDLERMKKIYFGSWTIPFVLALAGIILDYVTTIVGLSMGFYETNPQYNPVWALICFWGSLTVLTLSLPREKPWRLAKYGLALASYAGFVNNVLVIMGVFPGIQI